jgi:hypothetical protein
MPDAQALRFIKSTSVEESEGMCHFTYNWHSSFCATMLPDGAERRCLIHSLDKEMWLICK